MGIFWAHIGAIGCIETLGTGMGLLPPVNVSKLHKQDMNVCALATSCLLKYLILEEKGCLHRGNPIEVLPYNETDKKEKKSIPQGKESEKEGTEVQ